MKRFSSCLLVALFLALALPLAAQAQPPEGGQGPGREPGGRGGREGGPRGGGPLSPLMVALDSNNGARMGPVEYGTAHTVPACTVAGVRRHHEILTWVCPC